MLDTMDEVREANRAAGRCWFNPDTLRFFKSRIGSEPYSNKYFISSEKFHENSPRFYTVRIAREDGSIGTVYNFQQYVSRGDALRTIKHLIERGI